MGRLDVQSSDIAAQELLETGSDLRNLVWEKKVLVGRQSIRVS